MAEKPILFSGEMVRAILEGRKTQTRRVIKLRDGSVPEEDGYDIPKGEDNKPLDYVMDFSKTYPQWQRLDCPYGRVGDRLWVRETWRAEELEDGTDGIRYAADKSFIAIDNTRQAANNWMDAYDQEKPSVWKPSIFMPRWACRIILEVVNVRVERLQDITAYDIAKEGCPAEYHMNNNSGMTDAMHGWFENLWKKINGEDSWDSNPWLWVVEFKVVQ